jgi:uncharacterized protein (DUF983 family)
MLKKGSKLYSILTGTCPRCHEDHMYIERNPYYLTQIFKMHERCRSCGLKYKIEPSFFFGAMYVSYGLGVALSIALFIITFWFLNINLMDSFIAIVVMLTVLMPVIARVSRNIWINFFIHYDKNWRDKANT